MFEHFTFGTEVASTRRNSHVEQEECPSPKDTSTIIEDDIVPPPSPIRSGLAYAPLTVDCDESKPPSAAAAVDALAGELSKQYIRGWDSDIIVSPDPESETSLDDRIHSEIGSIPRHPKLASLNGTLSTDNDNASITSASPLEAEPRSNISILDCYVAFRSTRAGHVPASSAVSLASSGVRKNCGGLPLRFRHARDVANSSPNLVRNRPRQRRRDGTKTPRSQRSQASSVAGTSESSCASYEVMSES